MHLFALFVGKCNPKCPNTTSRKQKTDDTPHAPLPSPPHSVVFGVLVAYLEVFLQLGM